MVQLFSVEWQSGWSGDGATERCGECGGDGGRVERQEGVVGGCGGR